MAAKKAKAFRNDITLKNKESGHHCKASTNQSVHWTFSIQSELHSIHVAPKNKAEPYSIYTKDFNDVFTFSGSHQFKSRFIHTTTKNITNTANQIYLATSHIFHPATVVLHQATRLVFG
jgi:hypothetical protein